MRPSERGKVIHRIGDLIERHADELAVLKALGNGKPLAIAKAADVALAADLFHYVSGWATKIAGNTIPITAFTSPGSEFLVYTRKEPLGVVGQTIPWNWSRSGVTAAMTATSDASRKTRPHGGGLVGVVEAWLADEPKPKLRALLDGDAGGELTDRFRE